MLSEQEYERFAVPFFIANTFANVVPFSDLIC